MLEKQFMSKDESFKYTIEDLRSIISLMDEIKGFALVNKVGLPIAFLLPEEIDDYLIAAYSSAILSIVDE